MVERVVGPADAGKKVQKFVRQLLPGVPLSGIHKMIRTGRIKLNGRKAKADDTVSAGDRIALYMGEEDFQQVSKPNRKFGGVPRELSAVFETREILVVNKPVGLLTHGATGEHKDTLVNRVLATLFDRGELSSLVFTPSPVNRLDRNTSGLVMFAKTAEAAKRLTSDIAAHRVGKWYLALVEGRVAHRGEISAPLARQDRSNRTEVDAAGRDALTRYVRRASSENTSIVQVELVSGRTHQIRAHFAHIGHPLAGDFKYGGPRASMNPDENHQFLHSAWLRMADGRILFAPVPETFVAALEQSGYSKAQIEMLAQLQLP